MTAVSNTVTAPTFSGIIDQSFLIEPLQGNQSPLSYLDRFPDGVYDKSIDSHLVRFIYTLLGPAGVGSLKTNLLQARLIFESQGLQSFDMDAFYGNPFAFGRIVEETYNENLQGLLPSDKWDIIKAQDESYRTRAIDFFNGVRAGNSPLGMQLIAKSGLGHNVEVVENYKYLYDQHMDDPLGIPSQGKTTFLEEFTVLPRQEISQSTVQQISFGATYANAGVFYLTYRGQTTGPLSVGVNALTVQMALQALPAIGPNNVEVSGGPNPNPFVIKFRGTMANQDAGAITVGSVIFQTMISGNIPVSMGIATTQGGLEAADEMVKISDQNLHDLQSALDRIRPMHTFPTANIASGKTIRQPWSSVTESSAYVETRTYVTGVPDVSWPPVNDVAFWIEPDISKEAPMVQQHKPYHLIDFYRPAAVHAYTDLAVADPNYGNDIGVLANYKSERSGTFSDAQINLFPLFARYNNGPYAYPGFSCLAPQPEPIVATDYDENGCLFNYYYPAEYLAAANIYSESDSNFAYYFGYYYNFFYRAGQLAPFWSSSDRASGSEYLEIDLGRAMPLNFLSFEITHKPLNIEIDYDILDDPIRRRWSPLYPAEQGNFETAVVYDPQPTPWSTLNYFVQTAKGSIPFTRYIRLRFTRREADPTTALSPGDVFLWDQTANTQTPWSVEIRNLRVGRNVNQVDHDYDWRYNVPNYYWYGPWYGYYGWWNGYYGWNGWNAWNGWNNWGYY